MTNKTKSKCSKNTPTREIISDPYGSSEYAPVVKRITRREQTGMRELKNFLRKGDEVTVVRGANVSFAITSVLPVNPGFRKDFLDPSIPSLTIFPSARATASGYEQFRFRKLVLRYIPQVDVTESGSVILSWDRDALDPIPSSFAQLTREACSVSTSVYRSCELHFPPSPWLFTRETFEPSGADLKLYDYGVVYAALANVVSTDIVGRLAWDYELDFRYPTVNILSEPANPTNVGLKSRNRADAHSLAGATSSTNCVLGEINEATNGFGMFDLGQNLGLNGFYIPAGIPFFLEWAAKVIAFGSNTSLNFNAFLDGVQVNPEAATIVAAADGTPQDVSIRVLCPPSANSNATRSLLEIKPVSGATTFTLEEASTVVTLLPPGIEFF